MLRGFGVADSCATADIIAECANGERPGFKTASPATVAAATATQARMARFMIAPCRRICSRPNRRDAYQIATWLSLLFSFVLATIDVATPVTRQASACFA